jgi:hypothetical protein
VRNLSSENYRLQIELADEEFEKLTNGEEIVLITMSVGGQPVEITMVRRGKRQRWRDR